MIPGSVISRERRSRSSFAPPELPLGADAERAEAWALRPSGGIMDRPRKGCVMEYPVQFSVDYPGRPLNRLSTAFRIFLVIPIGIVLGAVSGGTWQWTYANGTTAVAAGAGGLLFFGPLLMILF